MARASVAEIDAARRRGELSWEDYANFSTRIRKARLSFESFGLPEVESLLRVRRAMRPETGPRTL